MSTRFKKRLFVHTLPVILLTPLFAILVQTSELRLKSTELNEYPTNQNVVIRTSTRITGVNNVKVTPEIKTRYTFGEFSVKVIFDEPLRYDQTYEISLETTDFRNTQRVTQTKIKTSSPKLYYLSRKEFGLDKIKMTYAHNDATEVDVHVASDILLYAISSESIISLDKEEDRNKLSVVSGHNKDFEITLPEGFTISSIDGSKSSDRYIITLLDPNTYKPTLWEYDNSKKKLEIVNDTHSNPIEGNYAEFAADGISVFYFDLSRNLYLDVFTDSSDPINLGKFSELSRILPNQSGIFGNSQNLFISISSSDGKELPAPTPIQSSAFTQQLNNMNSYVYIKQALDKYGLKQVQKLYIFEKEEELLISENLIDDKLILDISLSPNDQYILSEESAQPIFFDGLSPNAQSKNVKTVIYSRASREPIKTLDGFDVRWKL